MNLITFLFFLSKKTAFSFPKNSRIIKTVSNNPCTKYLLNGSYKGRHYKIGMRRLYENLQTQFEPARLKSIIIKNIIL